MIGRASVFNRNFFNTKTKPAFALEREVFAFSALPVRNGTMLDMKPAILVASILSLIGGLSLLGQDLSYSLQKDIPYQKDDPRKTDPYIAERCVLDLYAPENRKGFSTIVWFHGGGCSSCRCWCFVQCGPRFQEKIDLRNGSVLLRRSGFWVSSRSSILEVVLEDV